MPFLALYRLVPRRYRKYGKWLLALWLGSEAIRFFGYIYVLYWSAGVIGSNVQ